MRFYRQSRSGPPIKNPATPVGFMVAVVGTLAPSTEYGCGPSSTPDRLYICKNRRLVGGFLFA